jgi:uncharacterized sporulation protein YeaH/YhbH (DUF444 family)
MADTEPSKEELERAQELIERIYSWGVEELTDSKRRRIRKKLQELADRIEKV